MRAWNKATSQPWAITTDALTNILDVAARTNASPEAVAAKLGRELHNQHPMTISNGVAVIPIIGALFRYANVFTQVSGASSYEMIAKDVSNAFTNPDVHTILLNIDSPGGEVNGCCELAQFIYGVRGKKPIIAYGSGDVASGAYWIASSCDNIIVSKTSSVGSIGVVGVYRDNKDDNTVEIVSSQSPHKRCDIHDDDGRTRLQQRIDALANVFIDAVATYRNVSTEHVTEHFGGGDVFIGEHALQRGLVDRVSTLDNVLNQLQQPSTHYSVISTAHSQPQENRMNDITPDVVTSTDATNTVADATDLLIQGRIKERARIQAILTCDEAHSRMKLAQHLAFATDMDVESVMATLVNAPDIHSTPAPTVDNTGFHTMMNQLANPAITPSESTSEDIDNTDAIAKRIAES